MSTSHKDLKNEEWGSVATSQPPEEKDWQLKSVAVPELKSGEVLLQSRYISVDPYLHFRRAVGTVLQSQSVAEVIDAGDHKDLKKGDIVCGTLPWRRYNAVADLSAFRTKIDSNLAPLATHLGVFGVVTGMSAYFGLLDAASLKDNEQVLISGAAGAVGMVAGQIAKLKGCFVVGTAGGKDKCDMLVKEYGFDAAIDYKQITTHEQMKAELSKVFKNGIDVYLDNTGGVVTEVTFDLLRKNGRVAVCGQISQYTSKPPMIESFLFKLIYKSVTIKGFYISDYWHRYDEFMKDMLQWYKAGKIKSKDTIFKGFQSLPFAQVGLFSGKNTGKAVVEV